MANFLTARWANLIMANYEVSPSLLLPYIPNGTALDYYKGKTYVSLVGFRFINTKIFRIPIPRLGNFEEINLRFYVTRKEGNAVKRGVVFINETVPYKPIAWLANKLYKEHYITIPTRHSWKIGADSKSVAYEWKMNNSWNCLKVNAGMQKQTMQEGSIEEFIFEHYYGYTKVSHLVTEEYQVAHARWVTNPVNNTEINCDFEAMYGKTFSGLSLEQPSSVLLAEGSEIAIKWKRRQLA